MRYMVLVKMAEDVGQPPQELVEIMSREMGSMLASGKMRDAGGLGGTNESVEVRVRGGALSVTDGPYAEGKEVVGGFSIIEVDSHEEAVANARRVMQIHQEYWPGWEGSAELRRIWQADQSGQ
jgi:hypothetical protein